MQFHIPCHGNFLFPSCIANRFSRCKPCANEWIGSAPWARWCGVWPRLTGHYFIITRGGVSWCARRLHGRARMEIYSGWMKCLKIALRYPSSSSHQWRILLFIRWGLLLVCVCGSHSLARRRNAPRGATRVKYGVSTPLSLSLTRTWPIYK